MKILLFCISIVLFCPRVYGAEFGPPLKYTALLMVTEFAIIEAFDISDDSASSSTFREVWEDPAPENDDDNELYNYLLHPLMGSETYLRAREHDFDVAGSLAFSMGASITWEYLIEAWTEHPSVQDLVLTTGIGWMLGELRFWLKQQNASRGSSNFWIDPIWSTLEYFDISFIKGKDEVIPVFCLKVSLQ